MIIGSDSGWLTLAGMMARPRATSLRTRSGSPPPRIGTPSTYTFLDEVGMTSSLRWYYPGQVLAVGGPSPPSQPGYPSSRALSRSTVAPTPAGRQGRDGRPDPPADSPRPASVPERR